MPVNIDFYGFKCWNQLKNGEDFDLNTSDFTPNLVGNVGEKVKVEFKIKVTQSAFASAVDEWEIVNTVGIKEIRRSSGSFLDDDIQVGDKYEFFADWENRKSGSAEYFGTVESISSDGKIIQYSVDSLTDSTNGTVSNVGLSFDQRNSTNINTALFLKFGLIENAENFNFISKTSQNQQVYYRGDLTILNADVERVAESIGNIKAWVTGSATFEINSLETDFNDAEYIIRHEFVINPFFILGYRQFLNNDKLPPLFEGSNSLKYSALCELRKTLSNTGSSKQNIFNGLDGFVGWYNENFNGLAPDYEIVSINYEDDASGDPLTSVNISASTKITIEVSKKSGDIVDYNCGAYLITLPTSEDQYEDTLTDLEYNFIRRSRTLTSPTTSGTGIATSLSSGNLIIEFKIDYTTSEKLRLTPDNEFLLSVQVEDDNLSSGSSDRVMLLCDIKNYIEDNFIDGFVNVDTYNFLQHGEFLADTEGNSSIETSNEDGILLNALIGVDTTKEVVINSIKAKLLAYDGSNSFELDSYDFNIGEVELIGLIQQINLDTQRGYPLKTGDEFNLVKVQTSNLDGDFQNFVVQLGQKIKWQDWVLNPNVPASFFDSSKPNNNLNFKSSNYSDENSYKIYLVLVINVTGLDALGKVNTGDFINYGDPIIVNDYDESSDGVTGIIETFDPTTGNSLDGNILFNGQDTLFKATFENAGSMEYGIHRIEPSQNSGDGILELSSVVDQFTPNLLKPLAGETKLKFTKVGSDLTTECLIDGSLLTEGIKYKLSARVGVLPLDLSDAFDILASNTNNNNAYIPQNEF